MRLKQFIAVEKRSSSGEMRCAWNISSRKKNRPPNEIFWRAWNNSRVKNDPAEKILKLVAVFCGFLEVLDVTVVAWIPRSNSSRGKTILKWNILILNFIIKFYARLKQFVFDKRSSFCLAQSVVHAWIPGTIHPCNKAILK